MGGIYISFFSSGKKINIDLEAKTGDTSVRVWTKPEETEVFLNGVYMGKGSLTLKKVSPGEHLLKVTKEGYKDWQDTLYFYPGENYLVQAYLKTIDKEEVPLQEVSFKTPILVLIGLVIFAIVLFYYESLKKKKNKKDPNKKN